MVKHRVFACIPRVTFLTVVNFYKLAFCNRIFFFPWHYYYDCNCDFCVTMVVFCLLFITFDLFFARLHMQYVFVCVTISFPFSLNAMIWRCAVVSWCYHLFWLYAQIMCIRSKHENETKSNYKIKDKLCG